MKLEPFQKRRLILAWCVVGLMTALSIINQDYHFIWLPLATGLGGTLYFFFVKPKQSDRGLTFAQVLRYTKKGFGPAFDETRDMPVILALTSGEYRGSVACVLPPENELVTVFVGNNKCFAFRPAAVLDDIDHKTLTHIAQRWQARFVADEQVTLKIWHDVFGG
ncbi:hypothetical protein E2R33_00875 [Rathayibacter toxicus]|uniref:hypothetical protein n=1 Tax=Rathayibacter toxicus TaxID=145458 RepID=UPI001C03D858|nr:hypothetical protein [Rathayibacter toxicus]QWL27324.1 hypothetical protein E2R33_00875 [Rathayibacter toxicus]